MSFKLQRLRVEQVRGTSDTYQNFGEQILNMAEAWAQQFTPTNGQVLFNLNRPYTMGYFSLQVYVNGTLQPAGGDSYEEIDAVTVRFKEPLFDTDIVVFRVEGAGSGTTFVSDHGHVIREKPDGDFDGVNKAYALAKRPIGGSECVFLNGVLQDPDGDYAIDNQTLTFVTAPEADDKVVVNYMFSLRTLEGTT